MRQMGMSLTSTSMATARRFRWGVLPICATTPALSHTVTQPSAHDAQSHSAASNEPVYYELAFIIKE